jgi:hypothetical protein
MHIILDVLVLLVEVDAIRKKLTLLCSSLKNILVVEVVLVVLVVLVDVLVPKLEMILCSSDNKCLSLSLSLSLFLSLSFKMYIVLDVLVLLVEVDAISKQIIISLFRFKADLS